MTIWAEIKKWFVREHNDLPVILHLYDSRRKLRGTFCYQVVHRTPGRLIYAFSWAVVHKYDLDCAQKKKGVELCLQRLENAKKAFRGETPADVCLFLESAGSLKRGRMAREWFRNKLRNNSHFKYCYSLLKKYKTKSEFYMNF